MIWLIQFRTMWQYSFYFKTPVYWLRITKWFLTFYQYCLNSNINGFFVWIFAFLCLACAIPTKKTLWLLTYFLYAFSSQIWFEVLCLSIRSVRARCASLWACVLSVLFEKIYGEWSGLLSQVQDISVEQLPAHCLHNYRVSLILCFW